jgi:hypothetical protein
MSKVDDLKKKYSQVSPASFTKFVEADTTPTKKYLDFMLKTWEDRKILGDLTERLVASLKMLLSLMSYYHTSTIKTFIPKNIMAITKS